MTSRHWVQKGDLVKGIHKSHVVEWENDAKHASGEFKFGDVLVVDVELQIVISKGEN